MKLFTHKDVQWIFGFLLCFLVSALLSTLYSSNIGISLPIYISYVAGACVLFCAFLLAQREKYRRINEWLLFLFIAYSVVIAGVLLYQHFILHIPRPRSIVGWPNIAARYLELTIPVIISLLFYRGMAVQWRMISVIGLTIMLGGLFVTYTRGAWVAVGIAVLCLFVINKKYKLLSILALFIPILFLKDKLGLQRLNSIIEFKHPDNIERINGWISSIHMIADYPLTGIGFGNFRASYLEYMLPQAQEKLVHAHNILLIFGTESGIPTTVFFILFVISVIIYIIKGVKKLTNEYHQYLVCGMSFAVISLLINGMVDHPFHQLALRIAFFFELGFCLGIVRSYLENDNK